MKGSWRMTVFVICLLTLEQTAIKKKEKSVSATERRNLWVRLSPPPFSPKLEIPLHKMKRIKLLSLSPNKHKLFWHLINRQCGIVLKGRQVCLPHWWWIPLFGMESLLAFLSHVVTHLSPERGRFERWPKVITQTLPWCCCRVFSSAHHHQR